MQIIIELPAAQFDRLWQIVNRPAKPNPALVALFQKPSPWDR